MPTSTNGSKGRDQSENVMNRILITVNLAWAFLFLFAIWNTAQAADGFHDPIAHAKYHAAAYSKWRTDQGGSCCNDRDCRPSRVKFIGGGYMAMVDGKWCPVPPNAIRPYSSPDGRAHVCAMDATPIMPDPCRNILCVVLGAGG